MKRSRKESKPINYAFISRIILWLYIIIYFIYLYSSPEITSLPEAAIMITFAMAPIFISFSTNIWSSFKLLFFSLICGFGVTLFVGLANVFSDTPDSAYCPVAIFFTVISGICSLFYMGNNFLSIRGDWYDRMPKTYTETPKPNGDIKAEKNFLGDTIYKNSKGEVVAKGEKNIFGEEVIKNKEGNVVAKENNTIFGKSYVNKNNEVIGKVDSNILTGKTINDKNGNTKYKVEKDLFGNNVYHKEK